MKYFINIEKVIFSVLLFITTIIVFFDTAIYFNFKVLCVYYLICVLSLFGVFLSVDKNAYSLNKTFNIFTYFFFGLAPSYQFKGGIAFWNSDILTNSQYMELGIILIIIQICYLFFYKILVYKFNQLSFFRQHSIKKESNQSMHGYVVLSLCSFIFFLVLIKFDLATMFKRPNSGWLKSNTAFGLLGYSLLLIVRAIPIIVLIVYKIRSKEKSFLILTIIFFLALLTAFPTSLSRGVLVSYYLGLIIAYVPIFNRRFVYSLSYFFGLLFVFPILNFFRNTKNSISFGKELFITAHFDAFHNFAKLYFENIITNGRQFLGSLFFFIQESIWFNRPTGTGEMLAEKMNFSYSNIAMPLWGEGYVNFGFYGIFLFLILIVFINAFIDSSIFFKSNKPSIKILSLFMLGFEFYLLRGDLYSSIKKSTSFILALIITLLFLKFYDKYIYKKFVSK